MYERDMKRMSKWVVKGRKRVGKRKREGMERVGKG